MKNASRRCLAPRVFVLLGRGCAIVLSFAGRRLLRLSGLARGDKHTRSPRYEMTPFGRVPPYCGPLLHPSRKTSWLSCTTERPSPWDPIPPLASFVPQPCPRATSSGSARPFIWHSARFRTVVRLWQVAWRPGTRLRHTMSSRSTTVECTSVWPTLSWQPGWHPTVMLLDDLAGIYQWL